MVRKNADSKALATRVETSVEDPRDDLGQRKS
jgi:hypothetical protein